MNSMAVLGPLILSCLGNEHWGLWVISLVSLVSMTARTDTKGERVFSIDHLHEVGTCVRFFREPFRKKTQFESIIVDEIDCFRKWKGG